MTEDEAKTKWCPHAVASHTNPRMGFETPEQLGNASPYDKVFPCIASACMAWRKTGSKFKDARTGQLVDRDLTGHGAWIDTGHCGLAGSP